MPEVREVTFFLFLLGQRSRFLSELVREVGVSGGEAGRSRPGETLFLDRLFPNRRPAAEVHSVIDPCRGKGVVSPRVLNEFSTRD